MFNDPVMAITWFGIGVAFGGFVTMAGLALVSINNPRNEEDKP